MNENIATRVGRLVSGGFNALVDAIENTAPETVMDQAIREVDDAIADIRAELGKVVAKKHLASTRLMEENSKHEDAGEKIRLAVAQGRDDLAQVAIAKQMDVEAQIPILEAAISEAGDNERELEGYIRALQGRKREMQTELDNFRASREAASVPGGALDGKVTAGNPIDDKVERANETFDRILNRNGGVPGPSGPQGRESATKLAELDELARQHRIEERLAQIKAESSS